MDRRGIGRRTRSSALVPRPRFTQPGGAGTRQSAAAAAGGAGPSSRLCRGVGGDAADLPYYSTRQAVEDLEAVRAYLGIDTMHLSGRATAPSTSRPTRRAHPDRIAAPYLDGPVDLTLDGPTYYAEAARAPPPTRSSRPSTPARPPGSCKADVRGGDALAVYDALAARLRAAPIDDRLPDGRRHHAATRTLTVADLENSAVVGYLYSPGDRDAAPAGAGRGRRTTTSSRSRDSRPRRIALDPDTLEVVPDPTYSDALYYAVECQDYVYNADATDDATRLADYLDDAKVAGRARDPARRPCTTSDMPCLYWPNRPAADPRPAPIVERALPDAS